MNRRALLRSLGVGLTASLAGCTVGLSGPGATPDDGLTTPRGPEKPVPGNGKISTIQKITDSTMELGIIVPSIPREVTFELLRYTPSPSDPGEWRFYTIQQQTRPILTYDEPGEVVSRTKIQYEGDNSDGFITLDFPATDEPTGVPLSYGVRLVEHTLSNQNRHIGYTQLAVRQPDTGEFVFQEPRNGWTVRNFGYYDLFEYDRIHQNGESTITLTSSTSPSRWTVPRNEDVDNRPATVSGYRREWYERPWSLQYTITDSDYEEWVSNNTYDYIGHPSSTTTDYDNLERIFWSYFDNNSVLADLAETFNATAERAGLVTPLDKLRFICDIAQWMPYTDDRSIAPGKPRVKAPTTTLYEFTGDCEDKMCFVAGLLYQDAFPDYELATFYVDDPGHVGLAVRKDIFDRELDSVGNNDNYLYAEVTYPAPLGTVAPDWSTPRIMRTHPPGHPQPEK